MDNALPPPQPPSHPVAAEVTRLISAPAAAAHTPKEPPFGVNEVRLDARQWALTLLIVTVVVLAVPRCWEKVERFETGPDYRLPYQLSKDYWLYGRRLRETVPPDQVLVLGDSVVWGEYVLPDGTLSHFLNREAGQSNRFINGGVNGLFPLAMEGLVRYYGESVTRRKVILHGNMLWMTSPKADLSTRKEESFNHSRLVPQFAPRLPCYRGDASERLGVVVERQIPFLAWVSHLQNAYFGQKSITGWTLEDDGSTPRYPNARKNPLAQMTMTVPPAPVVDPQRGPLSSRHQPWSRDGQAGTTFEWVDADASLQWAAFQRVIRLLRERHNEVLVILGPFNEHLMTPENQAVYRKLREAMAGWFVQNQVLCVVPELLPSALYADASHPLTEGYALLARQLHANRDFQQWQASPEGKRR